VLFLAEPGLLRDRGGPGGESTCRDTQPGRAVAKLDQSGHVSVHVALLQQSGGGLCGDNLEPIN
jgi:hypothetical protein